MKQYQGSDVIFVFLIFIFLIFLTGPVYAETADKSGCFNWAFIKMDLDDNYSSLAFENKIIEKQIHDRLKIYLLPKVNSYIYFILFNPGNRFTLLFPGSFKLFRKEKTYHFKEYYLPADASGGGLFDIPGEYKLYFIVSAVRLPELEELIADARVAQEKKGDAAEMLPELDAEIQRINALYLVSNTPALLPAPIGGTYRSEEELLEMSSVEIKNTPYYVKFFTIFNRE